MVMLINQSSKASLILTIIIYIIMFSWGWMATFMSKYLVTSYLKFLPSEGFFHLYFKDLMNKRWFYVNIIGIGVIMLLISTGMITHLVTLLLRNR